MSGNSENHTTRDFQVMVGENGMRAFDQAMRASMQDMLMHGQSAYSTIVQDGVPVIERVDLRDLVLGHMHERVTTSDTVTAQYGPGIMQQIREPNVQAYNIADSSEENLRDALLALNDMPIKKSRRRAKRINRVGVTTLKRDRDER